MVSATALNKRGIKISKPKITYSLAQREKRAIRPFGNKISWRGVKGVYRWQEGWHGAVLNHIQNRLKRRDVNSLHHTSLSRRGAFQTFGKECEGSRKFFGANGDSPTLFIIQKNRGKRGLLKAYLRIMGRKTLDIGHGRK